MHIATVKIVLRTSSEKHVTSGSFQSRRRSGNRIINAVCFAVFLVLRNFSQNIFQRCYVWWETVFKDDKMVLKAEFHSQINR